MAIPQPNSGLNADRKRGNHAGKSGNGACGVACGAGVTFKTQPDS
jgi:hypothetical protein